MIRAAFIWLLTGGLTGTLMLAEKAIPFEPAIWLLLPVHISTMIFGWMIQFILGVAYWMLPKFLKQPFRGPRRPAFAVVCMVNLGLILSAAGHLVPAAGISGTIPLLLIITGYLLILSGIVTMAVLLYPRVISYRGGY